MEAESIAPSVSPTVTAVANKDLLGNALTTISLLMAIVIKELIT